MSTLRLFFASILFCGIAYTAAIHGFARIANPDQASGSLLRDPEGRIIGSRLIAQSFSSDRYFHPRPSACDFNARAAAGSNLSPTNPKLRQRAIGILSFYQVSQAAPLPADLVTASGSGLDPDITVAAARYQVARIAEARKVDAAAVIAVIDKTQRPLMGTWGGPSLVNVLELNLALDQISR